MDPEIETFFKQFVENFKPIFKLIPIQNKPINILIQYFPMVFEANFIVKDVDEEFYFKISPEYSTYRKIRNPYSMMTITLTEDILLEIIRGEKTILREFNYGNIHISNLKQNYMYRIIILGMLINSKRDFDDRRKLLK
ncbi:MAG: hypothetical protein GF329_03690, partial [Candidatus Lokiarchaeota archaeon]|nr:hypothetical protein [Candidatus Lokiarchaeota archaeon]